MRREGSPHVVIVIVNWTHWRVTTKCLHSLRALNYENFETIVVENGSTNESAQQLRLLSSCLHFKLLESRTNLGFGGGNNLGIRQAIEMHADYIWLLNSDTTPDPDALRAAVNVIESDPSVGAVGSVLKYSAKPLEVQAWGGGTINFLLGRIKHCRSAEDAERLDYLTAASILLRSSALLDAGFFDESFFLYWEDVDLSLRLRASGWKLSVAADSIVLHDESPSLKANLPLRDRYQTKSLVRFFEKHSRFSWCPIAAYIATRVVGGTLRGQLPRVTAVLRGAVDGLKREAPQRSDGVIGYET